MNDGNSPVPTPGSLPASLPGSLPLSTACEAAGVGPARRRVAVECGDLPFLICRDGSWLYRGSLIGRKELVCLFASVLRRDEDGAFWLETPVERGRIEVEDAPFVAVELDWTGEGRRQVLSFRTNVDQIVTAGRHHPIRVAHDLLTCQPTRTSPCGPAPAVWRSRPVLRARFTMNSSRWPSRAWSADGACWGSGAAACSSRWASCRPTMRDRGMTQRRRAS